MRIAKLQHPQQPTHQRLRQRKRNHHQQQAVHQPKVEAVQIPNPIRMFTCAQAHSKKIQKTATCSINVQKMMAAMT